jgi:hypothetical protein
VLRHDYTRQEPRAEAVGSTLDSWRTRQAQLQLALLGVGVAVAAIVVASLLLKSEGATPAIPSVNGGPRLVSQAQLEAFARTLDHRLYWAGPKDGFSLELTRATGGRIFVRYLALGLQAGDPRPDFLSVGTYLRPNSFAELKHAATRASSFSLDMADGGLVVFDTARPTNVYFAYPDRKYQVEVFSPSGKTARTLVLTGQITPV